MTIQFLSLILMFLQLIKKSRDIILIISINTLEFVVANNKNLVIFYKIEKYLQCCNNFRKRGEYDDHPAMSPNLLGIIFRMDIVTRLNLKSYMCGYGLTELEFWISWILLSLHAYVLGFFWIHILHKKGLAHGDSKRTSWIRESK